MAIYKKVPVNLRLDSPIAQAIDEAAEDLDVTRSSIIRTLIQRGAVSLAMDSPETVSESRLFRLGEYLENYFDAIDTVDEFYESEEL